MDMITEELIEHELVQGSPEWIEFRMSHDGASEAAAMLGLSKKMSRTELLRLKSSGITKEFSDWVQENILDHGHEVEALARPIIDKHVGCKLYPAVLSRGRTSASCDGLSISGEKGWEHKQWNKKLAAEVLAKELPDEFMVQPQQCLMVSSAKSWVFTVSDGTEENVVSMEIFPDPIWFERIRAGWEQFNKDRENYRHIEIKSEASGAPIKDLPAVQYEINGLTITSNIEEDVKPAVVALIEKFKRKPETDQDFADLDSFNKKARKAVVNSEATRATFKAKFIDIDAFERAMIELEELLTKAAIDGEKTFKLEKDNRKARIIEDGKIKYAEHIATLQNVIVGVRLIVADPDWVKAVYGLKTLDSYQNAVDTALANGKIAANAAAKDVRAKLTWCKENAAGHSALFPDLQSLISKPMEDFALTITSRIEKQKADEAARLEAQREEIRKQEEAKAIAQAKAINDEKIDAMVAEKRASIEAENKIATELEAAAIEERRKSSQLSESAVMQGKKIEPWLDAKTMLAHLEDYYSISHGKACDLVLRVAEELRVAA